MFADREINTGRQIEFDYLKGLFIPMILFIHSFQMVGGAAAQITAYKTIYIIATMTGSAIFLFVLGLGSTYSEKKPGQLVKTGFKLLIFQLLWNVLTLALPMPLGQGARALAGLETDWNYVWEHLPVMIQYINIFFIAGISYMMLALLLKLRIPLWAYFALAVIFIIVNPYLYMYGKPVDNTVTDYILTMFAGGRPAVSMCFLTHVPYVLCGVGFGRLLKRTYDKSRLYLIISIPAAAITVIYFIHALYISDGFDSFFAYSNVGYIYPDTMRALADLSCVMLMAALLYALRKRIESIVPLHRGLVHLSRKTTQYYGVHPFWYQMIASLLMFAPCSALFCLCMFFAVFALSYITLYFWDRIRRKQTDNTCFKEREE